jgi:alpha-D-xyloside xylohydrolase
MHGFREPKVIAEEGKTFVAGDAAAWKYTSGSANELWSYGKDVYDILKKYTMIRERLRPYIGDLMKEAHEKGTPLMRPLFYEYPKDENAWIYEDEYLFGAKILVAPILNQGETQRSVYLPSGTWIKADTREVFQGKQKITVTAPLEQIPVFAATKELAQCICPKEA